MERPTKPGELWISTIDKEGEDMAIPIAAIAASIPWKDLLMAAPNILAAAEKLRKPGNQQSASQAQAVGAKEPDVRALVKRIERLEESEVKRAALVKELAAQLNGVTEAVRVVALRTTIALGLSAVAALLAIAGLLTAIW
jgi:uncharacterized protein (UPF0335 family)